MQSAPAALCSLCSHWPPPESLLFLPRPSYGQEGKWGKGHITEEWTLLYHLERGLLNKPLKLSCFMLLKCLHSNKTSALIPYIGRWKENRICTHISSIRYQLFKKLSHLSTFLKNYGFYFMQISTPSSSFCAIPQTSQGNLFSRSLLEDRDWEHSLQRRINWRAFPLVSPVGIKLLLC